MLLQISRFPPFIPLCPAHPLPLALPPTFSSYPWIIHISSLASTFPVLFLTSPQLFCTYHFCYLFSVPFPPFSSPPSPADNPPCHLHFYDSVPDLVVCLVCFCCFLGSVFDNCEFVAFLLFIVFIFFFLGKSL